MDVIIIDDDAVILFLHKILIQRSSLPSRVTDFKRAVDALHFLSNRNRSCPVLIFLDINMPAMSGWKFLEELQKLNLEEKILVVMVTSSINRSDREKSSKYPEILDYVEKPLSIQTCEEIGSKLRDLI